MAAELGVAVGTLRKALSDLSEKGMLERVQGSGNYVRDNPNVDNIYALFRLELASGGGLPTAKLLDVTWQDLPKEITCLGASPQATCFRRIRSLDKTKVAAEEIWLAGDRAADIAAEDVGDSLYQFYRDRLGFRITRVEDRVSAAVLPEWAAPYFEGHAHPAWGFIERISKDENGAVAEFSRTWFDPELARFVAR